MTLGELFKGAKEKVSQTKQNVADWFKPTEEVRARDLVRELPGSIKKVNTEILNFGKDILQAAPRAAASAMLSKEGRDELKPETTAEKILFGNKPVKNIELTGRETLGSFGAGEETQKKYGIPVGIALGTLDLMPQTAGKGKLVTKLTKLAPELAKISDAAEIITKLTKAGVKEKVAVRMAKDLAQATELPQVNKILGIGKTAKAVAKNAASEAVESVAEAKITKEGKDILDNLKTRLDEYKAIKNPSPLIQGTIKDIEKQIAELPQKGAYIQEVVTAPKTSIVEEAKKYKSAEEFVKAKAILKHRSITPDIKEFQPNEKGIFFTKNAYGERAFGKGDVHITDAYVDLKKPFIANKKNVTELYQKNYGLEKVDAERLADDFEMAETTARQQVRSFIEDKYDGMIIPEDWDGGFGTIESIVAFDPNQIKTKSQLTDIWNKANKPAKQIESKIETFKVEGVGEAKKATGEVEKVIKDPIKKAESLGFDNFVKDIGGDDEAKDWAAQFWAKPGKKDVFYHVSERDVPFSAFDKTKALNYDPATRGGGISMINGHYIGQDQSALKNFYGMDKDVQVLKFKGNPKLLDLTKKADEENFIKEVMKKSGVVDRKSSKFGEAMEKELLDRGYDGAKYFDPYATGDEIVIVNQNIWNQAKKPIEKVENKIEAFKVDPKKAEELLAGNPDDVQHISEIMPSADEFLAALGGKKPVVKTITGEVIPKERKFITRVKELSPQTAAFLKGEYTPRSTEELAKMADEFIEKSYDEAVTYAQNNTDDRAVAIASRLIDKLVMDAKASKDAVTKSALYERAADIANETARSLTEHGRAIQAATLLGQLTPEGMVRHAARIIQKYNEGVAKTMGGFLGMAKKVPELTSENAKMITDAMEGIVKEADPIKKAMAVQKLEKDILNLVPSALHKKISTLWKAGMLTGLKTHGLNTLSNLTHGLTEVVKDAPATLVDVVSSLFTGKRTMAMTFKGSGTGIKEGVNKGWRYWKTGFDERDIGTKLDYHHVNFGNSKVAKGIQRYTETIFRALGTADQPAYYAAKVRSMSSQAIAKAKNAGLKGKEAKAFVENLLQNPTDDMLKYATMDAEMAVFVNKTGLGEMASAIGKNKVGQFVVPFTRTPAAVAMQVWNYSPGGIVSTIAKNLGKGKFDQRLFSQGIGRGITGTIGSLYIGRELYKNDRMALDWPTSEKEIEQWKLEGKKPNYIKIAGKWRSPAIMGPFGLLTVVGAHMEKAFQETGSPIGAIAAMMAGIGSTLTEQSFLQGLNQAMEAAKDPDRSLNGFASSFLGSAVPTIVADIARAADDVERMTTSPAERIKSRIPGARQTLEPKVSTFGEEAPTGSFWTAMFDPTRPGVPMADDNDPIVRELARLTKAGYQATPGQLGPKNGYESLSKEENTYLWKLSGLYSKRAIENLMKNKVYKTFDDEEKAKEIDKIVNDAKVEARAKAVVEMVKGLSKEETDQRLAQMKEEGLLTNQVYGKYISLRRRN